MSGQLPCLGVRRSSRRAASLSASSGGKASQGEPAEWVFGLSHTTTMRSARGHASPESHLRVSARSVRVRATRTRRSQGCGARHMKTSATPSRTYPWSRVASSPGLAGGGSRAWATGWRLDSSGQTRGRAGSAGRSQALGTSPVAATDPPECSGARHSPATHGRSSSLGGRPRRRGRRTRRGRARPTSPPWAGAPAWRAPREGPRGPGPRSWPRPRRRPCA